MLPSLDSFKIASCLFMLKWIARGKLESVQLFVPQYGIDKKLGWYTCAGTAGSRKVEVSVQCYLAWLVIFTPTPPPSATPPPTPRFCALSSWIPDFSAMISWPVHPMIIFAVLQGKGLCGRGWRYQQQ